MGFNTTANTVTLTAKLTPLGRQKMVSTNTSLITSFSLGDSDANYRVALPLATGQVPSAGGNIGVDATVGNSVGSTTAIRSVLVLNSSGVLSKSVEPESINVTIEPEANGQNTISGTNITYNLINRNSGNTDSLVNLFYSFGLPLSSNDDFFFTGVTSASAGFSNTALSGIAQTEILVIGINNNVYGEVIDGKTVKLSLPTTAGTFDIYSTFQNSGIGLPTQDANITDIAANTQNFGANIAFLFSDSIMKPNGGNPSLSWSTGYGTLKPFSVNQKSLYNFTTNSNLALTSDTAVGIAYLDKGFLVITNPAIVNAFQMSGSSATTITFDSVSTGVFQNITCIANRGEFGSSTNPTFGPTDIPRISEVGLYDNQSNLIAIAKTDTHLLKNVNQFVAIGIKISL